MIHPRALPLAAALLLAAAPASAQEGLPGRDGDEDAPTLQVPVVPEEPAPELTISGRPGGGLTFELEDELKLRMRGRFQALATATESDEVERTEALIRRARLTFDGYIYSRDLQYKMELAFAPRDLDETGSPVLDALLEWTPRSDLGLRLGLYKVPFDRQRVISSGSLQMVDRSPIIGEISVDRDVGLTLFGDDLLHQDERLRYSLGVYLGEGRGRLDATPGFLYIARLEALPLGNFDDYVVADLTRSSRPRLAVGASAGWNEKAARARSNRGSELEELGLLEGFDGFDYLHLEADAIFKWSGFSLITEFLWRDARGDDDSFTEEIGGETITVLPENTWGYFVQAGQMIGPQWEVVGRYSEQQALGGSDAEMVADIADAGRELGAGLNWYIDGHALKVQADYFRSWGVEEDGFDPRSFEDGDNRVRLQVQASF